MKFHFLLILTFATACFSSAVDAKDCRIFYTSKSQVDGPQSTIPEVKELSKVINSVLKESYQVLYKIDSVTLGLASALATRGMPIDHLKPDQWDKFEIVGNVIYQDAAFSGIPLRGAKLTFTGDKDSRTAITGSQGEFAESFSKLIPYTRIRLFSGPVFEKREQRVPTIKVPVTMKLESKICNAQLTLHEVPLEPLVFIVSKIDSTTP